ncbi:hypothetical protein GIX45_18545 [Erwinia sp. CPCC 100877]|nr:hypothetical protein [Erwinia sp. CPCC 100877]
MFLMPYPCKCVVRKRLIKQLSVISLISFFIFPLVVSSPPAFAARLESGVTKNNVPYVKMTGEIVHGDARRFRYILNQWAGKNVPIQVLDLNSPGGNVYEAYLMLQSVLTYKVSTIVLSGRQCVSACVLIFASGKERFASPQSIIGVHRVNIGGVDSALARSVSVKIMDLYSYLGIPDNIQLHMIKTPPSDVYYLSEQDKLRFNKIKPDTAMAMKRIQKMNAGR